MFEQHQHRRGREDLRVESSLGTKPILTSVYVWLMGRDGDFYEKGFAFISKGLLITCPPAELL